MVDRINKKFLKRLSDGCPKCDWDEAEGDLICHCAECQLAIVTMAYEIFVIKRRIIQRRRLTKRQLKTGVPR